MWCKKEEKQIKTKKKAAVVQTVMFDQEERIAKQTREGTAVESHPAQKDI